MITKDMRFDSTLIKKMVGKEFVKYRCDQFVYTNSVTQIVGLFIGDEVFKLTNIQEPIDYYGYDEDVSLFSIEECKESDIKSAFAETEQIDTPQRNVITEITLVNDHQMTYSNGEQQYDVWLTRAIIIKSGEYEVMFEKDSFPYSEEINIYRGYSLKESLDDEKVFLEDWDDDITPGVEREFVVIS